MQADEQQIRELVASWMNASKAGDVNTILSLMAEDVVFLVPDRPPMIGKSAFAAATHAQSARETPQFDGRSEIQEIRILGDWAYMWTKLSVVMTAPGGARAVTRAGHTLSILRKQDEKMGVGTRCEYAVAGSASRRIGPPVSRYRAVRMCHYDSRL